MKLYGMVPCLTRGEMGKGFFGEDVCEVFVALWNGALGRCKQANWSLGLRNALHYSVSKGVIQRK